MQLGRTANRRAWRPRLVAGLVTGLVLSGCTPELVTTTPAPSLVTALCAAAEAPTTTDAVSEFERTHDDLHTLARTLQERDERPAAGRLLEAKQAVEADIAAGAPEGQLYRDLAVLADAAVTATTLTDPSADATCSEGTTS